MPLKRPMLVYRGTDKFDAQSAKSVLLKHGINAVVKGEWSEPIRALFSGLLGRRTVVASGPFGLDTQVFVEQEDYERAAAVLEDRRKRERPPTGDEGSYDPAEYIRVVCDECQHPLFFHNSKRGRVEQCPHCTEYVDVE